MGFWPTILWVSTNYFLFSFSRLVWINLRIIYSSLLEALGSQRTRLEPSSPSKVFLLCQHNFSCSRLLSDTLDLSTYTVSAWSSTRSCTLWFPISTFSLRNMAWSAFTLSSPSRFSSVSMPTLATPFSSPMPPHRSLYSVPLMVSQPPLLVYSVPLARQSRVLSIRRDWT